MQEENPVSNFNNIESQGQGKPRKRTGVAVALMSMLAVANVRADVTPVLTPVTPGLDGVAAEMLEPAQVEQIIGEGLSKSAIRKLISKLSRYTGMIGKYTDVVGPFYSKASWEAARLYFGRKGLEIGPWPGGSVARQILKNLLP